MDDRTYDDLAMALMYAMSWKEQGTPEGYRRSWIGLDFDSLDRLEDRGLVSGRHGNKSSGSRRKAPHVPNSSWRPSSPLHRALPPSPTPRFPMTTKKINRRHEITRPWY